MSRIVTLLAFVVFLIPSVSFGQSVDKLDPILKRLVALPTADIPPSIKPVITQAGGEPRIDVFIRSSGGITFSTPGVIVKASIGNIVVASVPVSMLETLAEESHVQSLHAPKVWASTLDKSVHETTADTVRSNYSVKGKDIIIGVIDTGIDWQHPDFRMASDASKTRIKFLWDMSDITGPPPTGFGSSGGTEYDETQINGALAGSDTVNAQDQVGHGTHVAGIAGGLNGMAPDAHLIIVKATRSGGQSFASTDVVTALDYIDKKAGALGKPYVVNLSLGGQQGPHDGRSTEASAIDNLVGPGIEDKVAVAAAGNDGNNRIHARGILNANSVLYESRSFTADAGAQVSIDIWTQVSPNTPVMVFIKVAGPDTSFESSGFPPGATSANNSDGFITLFSSPFPVIQTGTDIHTDIKITVKKTGSWTISLRGNRGEFGTGQFDMWIYSGNAEWNSADGDFSNLVGSPGASNHAITVGAYTTKKSWTDADANPHAIAATVGDWASFSSPGPTRDGRRKPEISAPGQLIASSLSRDATSGGIFNAGNILPGNLTAIAQGTSQATPHVTGAVALLMEQAQRDSVTLDARIVRDALQASARSDASTGTVPNDEWGFGKMDVDSLFRHLLGPPKEPTAIALTAFTAETVGRRIRLDWTIADVSNHAGFHIFRSQTPGVDHREKVNGTLITGGPVLQFTDVPPKPGIYYYWLADVERTGHTTFHGPVVVTYKNIPASFRLAQSRPNPFNPSTTIEYDLPRTEQVVIRIYDILGREVRTLVNERQAAGFYEVVWHGRNQQGQAVGSGVYLYTLNAGDFLQSRKMTLLK
ncbi:MAG: S8 family serine peptidase [Gemmatimonadota bacterium]|nr:S8 family serine peptidase [Gemmatimonadota bacterium]